MKRNAKKSLYESIMTAVAKQVKKALNEGTTDSDLIDRWDNIKDIIGADEMCNAIFQAMSQDEIQDMVKHLERVYDITSPFDIDFEDDKDEN